MLMSKIVTVNSVKIANRWTQKKINDRKSRENDRENVLWLKRRKMFEIDWNCYICVKQKYWLWFSCLSSFSIDLLFSDNITLCYLWQHNNNNNNKKSWTFSLLIYVPINIFIHCPLFSFSFQKFIEKFSIHWCRFVFAGQI